MERLIILARHGRSEANAAQRAQSPESRIQGASVNVRLDSLGEWQGRAFGLALGRFVTRYDITIDVVHSSDAKRALDTRDNALGTSGLELPLALPDPRLRELCKGEQEGELRSEVFVDPVLSRDWHYRYGSRERGGETLYEAGVRWVRWFYDAMQPELPSPPSPSTLLAFGHNGVTACGLWLLAHPGQYPADFEETQLYRADNGTALLIAREAGSWHVLSERIVPVTEDYEMTKEGS